MEACEARFDAHVTMRATSCRYDVLFLVRTLVTMGREKVF